MSPIPICLLSSGCRATGYITYHHLTEENFSLDALLEDLEVPVCNPHLSHHHHCRNDLLAPVSEKELVEKIQIAVPNATKTLRREHLLSGWIGLRVDETLVIRYMYMFLHS